MDDGKGRVYEASSTENRRSQRRRTISCDGEDILARRTCDEVKASIEAENLLAGAKELEIGRKERPARTRGGDNWAGGEEKGSGSTEADNWYEYHEPSVAIFRLVTLMYCKKR